jgi:phosphatidate cytidylyltransferase
VKSGNWNDLATRSVTGVVLAAVGLGAILSGGLWFTLLVVIAAIAMTWELLGMLRPALRQGKDRGIFVTYQSAILLGCLGLIAAGDQGAGRLLFIVGLVVVTDILGYFAGRMFGGPKFWPAVSPKKTWSGTAAGWVGSAILAYVYWPAAMSGFSLAGFVTLAVFLSFASQMGDIAESAIKRRAGVKDSSNLLPGHGGVMDRFDGMVGVGLLLWLVAEVQWIMG